MVKVRLSGPVRCVAALSVAVVAVIGDMQRTQWSATADRLDTLGGDLDSALRSSAGSAGR
jgi:hypothetical protein